MPSAMAGPSCTHVCIGPHFSVPLHGLWSSQIASPFCVPGMHVKVQSLLQPIPDPLADPRSHCSPCSTIWSPHTGVTSLVASAPPSRPLELIEHEANGHATPKPPAKAVAPNHADLARIRRIVHGSNRGGSCFQRGRQTAGTAW